MHLWKVTGQTDAGIDSYWKKLMQVEGVTGYSDAGIDT